MIVLTVLGIVAFVLCIALLFAVSFVITYLNGWPLWWHDLFMNAFWCVLNLCNAVRSIVEGNTFGIALFAALAGFSAWICYEIWRRNRRKRKRRDKRAASRIQLVAGRLRVVPIPAK